MLNYGREDYKIEMLLLKIELFRYYLIYGVVFKICLLSWRKNRKKLLMSVRGISKISWRPIVIKLSR